MIKIVLVILIIILFIKLLSFDKDKCFEERKNKDGVCYGMMDCDRTQGYLDARCMDCKYHTPYIKEK